jgi:protein-S-isoprenylcysteine O-methyltransferase Ste14
MNLLPDWQDILKKAWSVKAAALLVILGAAQSAFAVIGEPLVGPVWAGAITSLIAALMMIARILTQKQLADAVGLEGEPDGAD